MFRDYSPIGNEEGSSFPEVRMLTDSWSMRNKLNIGPVSSWSRQLLIACVLLATACQGSTPVPSASTAASDPPLSTIELT
ncbi:uncharacterized protein METZ01_LOCUS339833, partial [marine metagenome]